MAANNAQHLKQFSHPARRVGPHSSPASLAKVDWRSKEGQLLRRVRKELTEFVGRPNAVQNALIERCAWLSLRISMLDVKLASGRDFTEIDNNSYLAWSNSLTRTLAKLESGVRQEEQDLARAMSLIDDEPLQRRSQPTRSGREREDAR